jgi:hypothetical protein
MPDRQHDPAKRALVAINPPVMATTTTASWRTPGVLIGEGFECEITPQWIARIEVDMFFFDATDVTFTMTGGPPLLFRPSTHVTP